MKAITIYYDQDSGEMTKLTYAIHFKDSSLLMKADVLRDVIAKLIEDYDAVLTEYEQELHEYKA